MYMYQAAVHNLDAEFPFLEMATSNAFFSLGFVPSHTCFYLSSFRAGGELCLRLQFGTRSGRQH